MLCIHSVSESFFDRTHLESRYRHITRDDNDFDTNNFSKYIDIPEPASIANGTLFGKLQSKTTYLSKIYVVFKGNPKLWNEFMLINKYYIRKISYKCQLYTVISSTITELLPDSPLHEDEEIWVLLRLLLPLRPLELFRYLQHVLVKVQPETL